MDTRDFSFEVKSSTDSGQFEGLAATYGNVDHGFDRILAGAFTATIAERGNELPILWAHDTANPVGLGELSDSREGLKVAGQLDMDVVSGREAYSRVKKRIVRGLSIGYQVPEGGATMENGIRVLKRLDLFEVSLVAIPMNDRARVTSVKAQLTTLRQFEQWLRDAGGLSKSEAQRVAVQGFKGLGMIPEEDPILAELGSWLAAQK